MKVRQQIQQIDWKVLDWIYIHLRRKGWNRVMVNLTRLGNMGLIWFSTLSILFLGKIHRRAALAMLFSLLGSALLGNILLKNLVRRPRPFNQRKGYDILIPPPQDYSFPSGHTSSSFAAATILCFFIPALAIPAMIVAILIAFSRLYLCVHFLSDVLFSLFLGVSIAISVFFLMRLYYLF